VSTTTVLLRYTAFPDNKAQGATLVKSTWPELVEKLRRMPPQPVKDESPMLKLAMFGLKRSPKNSLRSDPNVLRVTGLEGDYDAEEITPEEAVRRLERHHIRAVVVTSWSHRPEAPRWRVYAPLSQETDPSERGKMLARLNGALWGILAGESFTLSQSYYVGGRPGGEYRVLTTFDDAEEGFCIDELDELDAIAVYPARKNGTGSGRSEAGREPREMEELVSAILTQEDYHNALRAAAMRMVKGGMAEAQVVHWLRAAMVAAQRDEARRDARWQDRYASIPKLVLSAAEKLEQSEAAPHEPSLVWPGPLAEEAYHGLAGDVVRTIGPHSEADPVALLATLLVTFGNMVGPDPHFRVEGDKHGMRLFVTLSGETSKGRKGTSLGRIKWLAEIVDPDWSKARVVEGLSSGEGLIHAVRDPVVGLRKGEEEVIDNGVEDKRLLVTEGELSRVLKVMGREGNTLSPLIRSAWDTGNLATLTKNSPTRATGAHISILAHITKQELLRDLTATESANGFGNRFLWLMVRRSKCLPFGGDLQERDLLPLAGRLREAVAFARGVDRITWAEETRPTWARVYPPLSDGRPGLVGAMTSRAEAQVTRLASIYALLDRSYEISPPHLAAALALWTYAEASVRYLVGTLTGDPTADEILSELQKFPGGLTRTEISDLFQRHKPKEELSAALATLERLGKARPEKRSPAGGKGRPVESWHATEREISEESEISTEEDRAA
jgi:hypothetical protein